MCLCSFSFNRKPVVITGRQSGHYPGRKPTAVHVCEGDRGLRDAEGQGKMVCVYVACALFVLNCV